MHRIRDEIKSHRIAKANQIRGLVTEYGLVAPQQLHALRRAIPDWLEDAENGLSFLFRQLLQGLWGDLYALDQRMTELDKQIAAVAQEDPTARRLQQLRGVGPLIATALVATVGDATQFGSARQFAAWLGLVPRQQSSGGKERLGRISKRGDGYLRRLLVHGARIVLFWSRRRKETRSDWLEAMLARRPTNVVMVAMANKTARIVWAMLSRGEAFQPGRRAVV